MKNFKNRKEATEYMKTIHKDMGEVVTINGRIAFVSSTSIPIENRFRYPIEAIVNDFFKEVGFGKEEVDKDEINKDDIINLIGAEVSEYLIKKITRYSGVIIASANLDF